MNNRIFKTGGFNPEEDDLDPYIDDSTDTTMGELYFVFIDPSNDKKETVVLSIYKNGELVDVIEGYDEVVKSLEKWKNKFLK